MSTPAMTCSKPVQSTSSPEIPLEQDEPKFLTVGYSHFSIANLTALYNSTFAEGFSNDKRQATDERWSAPYVGFNPSTLGKKAKTLSNEELAEAALQDIFDVVTMQDRLDGGITVMLHCAGVKSTSTQMVDEVTVDLYVTPRELHETPERIGSDIVVLVQAFCQEFALPHFQCFNKCCNLEIITPPESDAPASSVNIDGPQYLPFPLSPTSSHIRCSAQDPSLFNTPANTKTDSMPLAAIRQVKEIANRSNVPPSPQKPQSIQ
ncbi:hypothetical protein EDD16DRAFT_1708666 [Pisolithus croceorrhizus]|nr:hypothetical protein EDD16DRAFT_1708666 [Pisolithus croceorrhizus]